VTTEEWLLERFGPTLNLDEIAEVLKKAPGSLRNDYYAGRLQIPTYREGARRVAAVADVAAYLESRRQEANKEQREAQL
jgi:hypothetical protein